MSKSLESFKTESSIRKEVYNWTIADCEEYIEKHKKDKSQSLLLKKKLKIVKEILNIKKVVLDNNIKGEKRYALLSGIKIENLVQYAPNEARDPKGKSLRSYQKNTGIYLWKKGYDPEKFLGAGVNGVVWKCGERAIKVTCDNTYGPINITKAVTSEVKDSEILEKLLKSDVKKGKYLSTSKYMGKENVGKRAIFESGLATHGTLDRYVESAGHKAKVGSKGIRHIIKLMKQALKGLDAIHDAGYSHNDIKPDNLLIVEKDSKKVAGVKKDVMKIADFGAMTEIEKTRSVFGNMKFRAPDAWKLSPKAVEKRDSYSLGAVMLFVLIKDANHKDVEKYLLSKGSEFVYYRYGLDSIYNANDEEKTKNKIIKFLELISKMIQPNYSKRISIKDALNEVKELESH